MEIKTIDGFVPYWERIRKRTVRVASQIPEDQIEWSPGPGRYSFGDMLRHLGAIERYMFAENAHLRPSRYPGHEAKFAVGFDNVMSYLATLHGESVGLFGLLSPEDLQKRCTTPGGASIPVWKWLRAMVEHEVHHRGQIYHMLTTIGVETPPLYGLTAEEVFAASDPYEPGR
ncbi:MAG: DinB family protein [Longimicrobiales bacterium]